MATPQDAELILKLYDLRREATMREARKYATTQYFPKSLDDMMELVYSGKHPQESAYVRQFLTYWEMAAALVNHGTIDSKLFYETNGEFFVAWLKLEHFIDDFRANFGSQSYANLEKLVNNHPGKEKLLPIFRERLKRMAEGMAAKQN